jgi:hypothetical protein
MTRVDGGGGGGGKINVPLKKLREDVKLSHLALTRSNVGLLQTL